MELTRTETLQRTKTETHTKIEKEIENLTSGTLNYGLVRAVGIMLLEQKDLYWRFALSGFACIIGGGKILIGKRVHDMRQAAGPSESSTAFYLAPLDDIVSC